MIEPGLTNMLQFFAQSSAQGLPPWLFLLLIVALMILVMWLVLSLFKESERPERITRQPEPTAVRASTVKPVDNLIIIEGIGPKICAILNSAGIVTFAQLADMQPEQIKQILGAAGIRLADVHSWPEQARLAASGDLARLKALQDRLKAGREV